MTFLFRNFRISQDCGLFFYFFFLMIVAQYVLYAHAHNTELYSRVFVWTYKTSIVYAVHYKYCTFRNYVKIKLYTQTGCTRE